MAEDLRTTALRLFVSALDGSQKSMADMAAGHRLRAEAMEEIAQWHREQAASLESIAKAMQEGIDAGQSVLLTDAFPEVRPTGPLHQ